MSKSLTTVICFHGFLGSEHDFDFLKNKYNIFVPDLKPKYLNADLNYETFDQIKARVFFELETYLNSLSAGNELEFLSYSMGSKVLFSMIKELFSSESFNSFKDKAKFIFLSSHFGLYLDQFELNQEFQIRLEMNKNFLNLLEKQDLDLFLKAWNSMGLFSKDRVKTTDWSKDQIVHYFKNLNQSQKEDVFHELNIKLNSFVFYGSEDVKYKLQALRLKEKYPDQFKIFEIPGRSHRLLEDSDFEYIFKILNQRLSNEF